jgi:hypothetical protein
MKSLTAEEVKRRGGTFDLGIVVNLELVNLRLDNVDVLKECTSLRELNLAGNRIKDVVTLAETLCHKITHLDLSDNHITSLRGIGVFTELQVLHLQGNKVASLSELNHLAPLRRLRVLQLASDNPKGGKATKSDSTWLSNNEANTPREELIPIAPMQGNRVCRVAAYMVRIRELLPMLKVIDGEAEIGYNAALRALNALCADTQDAFAIKGHSWLDTDDVKAVQNAFSDSTILTEKMTKVESQIRREYQC